MPGSTTSPRVAARNLAKVLRAGRSGVNRDLGAAGTVIVGDLRLTLSKPGQGVIYTTRFFTDPLGRVHPYGTRPPHRASAPGDPPAVDTGQLRASYSGNVTRDPDGATLAVGTGSGYAAYLEFGTSKMAARPHLRPVIARHHLTIRRKVAEGIEGRERAMARRLGGRG